MLQHHALSPQEVQQIAGKPISVFKYSDLVNFQTINDLFTTSNFILLLYETKQNSGHWCCLINKPKVIEFFDPYAFIPDDQLEFANIKFRKCNSMELPYLTYLMYNSNKTIDYNNVQLQKLAKNIQTCGYWCGIRMRESRLSNDKFAKMFINYPVDERDNLILKISHKYI